jgi:hypothetical protein
MGSAEQIRDVQVGSGWGPCDEGCQLIWCVASGTGHPGRFFIIKSVYLARIGGGDGISYCEIFLCQQAFKRNGPEFRFRLGKDALGLRHGHFAGCRYIVPLVSNLVFCPVNVMS